MANVALHAHVLDCLTERHVQKKLVEKKFKGSNGNSPPKSPKSHDTMKNAANTLISLPAASVTPAGTHIEDID